jgi:hypothetical protein
VTEFVSREQWGAEPARPGGTVFAHEEAGGRFTSLDRDQEAARVRQIQSFTMNVRGYDDIPYGMLPFPSGRVYEGRDLSFIGHGRDAEEAATWHNNATSIAICWPGNLDVDRVTPVQITATSDALALAVLAGRVTEPFAFRPHRAVYATDCPGAGGMAAIPLVLADYTARHTHGAPPPTSPPHPLLEEDDMAQMVYPDAKLQRGKWKGHVPVFLVDGVGNARRLTPDDVKTNVYLGMTPPVRMGRAWVEGLHLLDRMDGR